DSVLLDEAVEVRPLDARLARGCRARAVRAEQEAPQVLPLAELDPLLAKILEANLEPRLQARRYERGPRRRGVPRQRRWRAALAQIDHRRLHRTRLHAVERRERAPRLGEDGLAAAAGEAREAEARGV